MAHEISIVDVGGRQIVEAMYANKPAWHNLGEVFDLDGDKGPDGQTARQLAHLEWGVQLEKIHLAQDQTPVDGWWATVRQDTRATLGVVGSRYAIHQNEEAFNFVDSLVQDGVMRYESAFALHGGRDVVLLARLPSVDIIAEGDQTLRYIAWMNSHDGKSPIVGLPTSVRVVCANTKALALKMGERLCVKITHSGEMQTKLALACRYLSQFDKGFTLFRDQAQLLATRRFTEDERIAYLDTLFPEPMDKDGKPEGSKHTRWEHELERVAVSLRHPSQVIPSIEGTWWSLFNGVSYAVDHFSSYKGHKGASEVENNRSKSENRFASLSNGPGADAKDEAFDLACKMAGVALAV